MALPVLMVFARRAFGLGLVFALLFAITSPALAQAIWTGAADPSPPNGVYNNPGNWSGTFGLVPAGGDFAIFNANATYTTTFTGNQGLFHAAVRGGQVSWLSDSATVRQFTLNILSAGGPNQTLTIGSSTKPLLVTSFNPIEAGTLITIGSGAIVVDGANSALNGPSILLGSFNGFDGTVRYQNGAQGNIGGAIELGNAASDGSDGLLEILSGADLTSGAINLATTTSTATGTFNVSGAGSTLVQSGASTLTVGSTIGGAGTVNVNTGGTFTSGSGLVTVNATGTINRTGTGVFNVAGNLLLDGGKFLTPGGSFSRGAGQSFTVQNGGLFDATPSTAASNAVGVNAGSLATAGTATIANGTLRFVGGQGGAGISAIARNNQGGAGGIGGSLQLTGGSLTLTGTALATFDGGLGGNNGAFSGGAAAGSGGQGGTLTAAGASVEVHAGASVSLNGGAGGVNPSNNGSGGHGGGSGQFNISVGTVSVNGGTISLSGGAGGAASAFGNGGNGGNGGALSQSGGSFNFNSGTIALRGGTGGAASFLGNLGANGAAGSVNVTGGTFNFTAGQITADASIIPPTPAALVKATMNVSGGAVNLLNNFTNHLGTLNLTSSGVINGNGANGAPAGSVGPGGTGAPGRSITTSGSLALSGTGSQINLLGGAGGSHSGDFSRGGIGGAGGTLSVTGGTTTLSDSSVVSLAGGSGGSGIPSHEAGIGGAGGTLNVTGGTTTLASASVVSLVGGNGGLGGNGFGPNGGAGGATLLSGGVLNVSGGKILLAGGAGGSGGRFFPAGAAGAAGSFNMTGGEFNFTAGQVTGNTAIVPTAPIALVGATMNVSAGALNTAAGEFGITNGATLNLSGGVMNASTVTLNNSAFNFTGGTLHATAFNGDLVNNGGTLAPGTSPGTTTVNGNYTQSSGALEIELGGTSAGQFDLLSVTGNTTLGGAIDVNLFGGFTPTIGQSWEIIDVAGTLSGAFAGLAEGSPFANYGGTLLTISYAGGDGNDVFINTVAGLAGDFDFDDDVDGADFLLWQRGASPNPLSAGDLATWQANFGSPSSTPRTSTVPEPHAFLLSAIACLSLRRRRRELNFSRLRTPHREHDEVGVAACSLC
ncbi:beta strand repeat-containing protein [Lacipirellula limnantheis]|uniref:Autotransporter-associated beta strand repeat protein n=1 Tax=Lacipirellula limnantheis TaxID=2528024 RepID=A0A517TZ88_9BACT|nr:hypothetical protein [Lacipirellula limnantheis]QDT73690.1 hypothetical protein I41_28800 [Lacipirellula limnantheis]